jgi:hypothetical protein
MTKDTAEPTTADGVAARPDVLSLERATAKHAEQLDTLDELRAQMIKDLQGESGTGQWKLDALFHFHANAAIVHETWARLWLIVITKGADDHAWGAALTTAMELATGAHDYNGLPSMWNANRADAAKRWIRNQRRSWAALPVDVLAWAPFEF